VVDVTVNEKGTTMTNETYFEEFIAEGPPVRAMGVRLQQGNPEGRRLASDGRRMVELTEPVTLVKGVRQVTYRASAARPLRAWTMLWRLEGKERSV